MSTSSALAELPGNFNSLLPEVGSPHRQRTQNYLRKLCKFMQEIGCELKKDSLRGDDVKIAITNFEWSLYNFKFAGTYLGKLFDYLFNLYTSGYSRRDYLFNYHHEVALDTIGKLASYGFREPTIEEIDSQLALHEKYLDTAIARQNIIKADIALLHSVEKILEDSEKQTSELHNIFPEGKLFEESKIGTGDGNFNFEKSAIALGIMARTKIFYAQPSSRQLYLQLMRIVAKHLKEAVSDIHPNARLLEQDYDIFEYGLVDRKYGIAIEIDEGRKLVFGAIGFAKCMGIGLYCNINFSPIMDQTINRSGLDIDQIYKNLIATFQSIIPKAEKEFLIKYGSRIEPEPPERF